MDFKAFFKNKKFKYGSAAIAFTCVCIAMVIIFNVIFSALADKFLWSVDMTSEQLFTLSDATHELLKDVDEEITINFCQPLDTLVENEVQNLIYQCAKEYEKHFDNIKVEYLDIITNPAAIEKYANSSDTRIQTTSVVVTSENDSRTFTRDSFFATDSETSEVLAFDGELKLTSAILQLTSDNPIAYFSTGHGETTGTSNSTRPDLWKLFETAGYDVKTIDLTKEEFEDEAQVLIINDPIKDFLGFNDAVNEIDKIAKFLDNLGNLMVFVDPETPDLPELEALLEEWGIKIEDAVIKDSVNALSADGLKLNANYPTDTMGSGLHTSLRNHDSIPKTIVNYARPLTVLWGVDGNDITNSVSTRHASAVLTTYNTAKAYSFGEEKELESKSPFNLMTITREEQIIDNEVYYSYVMVTGSTDFALDSYLHSSAYANSEILYSAMRFMGKETVPTNIAHKYLEDESLEITTEAANNWTLAVTVIMPVIIFAIGVVIQIRRKHL